MPGKKKGGGNRKKGQKGIREEEWADNKSTFYAVVLKKMGGQHVRVLCHDGKERHCYIRGKFRRRIWMDTDSVLLISYREDLSDDNKCDVIRKYTPNEINVIRGKNHLDFYKGTTGSFGGYNEEEFDSEEEPHQTRDNVASGTLDDDLSSGEESKKDESEDEDEDESEDENSSQSDKQQSYKNGDAKKAKDLKIIDPNKRKKVKEFKGDRTRSDKEFNFDDI